MDIKIVAIANFALDAQERMHGLEAGASALADRLREKIECNTITMDEIKEWVRATQSNVRAAEDAEADFRAAIRLLGAIIAADE